MFCTKCGAPLEGGKFCAVCGTSVNAEPNPALAPKPVVEYIHEPVAVAEPLTDSQRLIKAFSSKLFLAVAILLSVGIGLAFLAMLFIPAFSFAILAEEGIMSEMSAMKAEMPTELTVYFGILCLVFCIGAILPIIQMVNSWRLYAGAKNHNTIECGALKAVTTVLRIEYVLQWIIPCILGLGGLFSICMFIVRGEPVTSDIYGGVEYNGVIMLILSILFIIIAAVYVVFLLLYYRRRVRFAKELVTSVETGVINLTNPKAVYNWMLVMGIISGVSALSGGFTAALPAAVEICLSFWIKENFVKDE